MSILRTVLLVALLLSAYASAARLSCTAQYPPVVPGIGGRETKNCGEISDEFAEEIKQNMLQWSNGQYEAVDTSVAGLIRVQLPNKQKLGSKGAASAAVQAQEQIINAHRP